MHEDPGSLHDDSRTEQSVHGEHDHVRQLSHATAGLSRLDRPSSIYLVCGSLSAADHGLYQAFQPLDAFLQREKGGGRGCRDRGRSSALALQHYGQVLGSARRHAYRLSVSAADAQTAIPSVQATARDSSGSQSPAVGVATDVSALPVPQVLDVQAHVSAPVHAPERTSRRARRGI